MDVKETIIVSNLLVPAERLVVAVKRGIRGF